MFDLSLNDAASPALAAMPDRLRAALAEQERCACRGAAGEDSTKALRRRAQYEKRRAGRIDRRHGRRIVGEHHGAHRHVADVKYAAIHEFGGTIPPHQIVPDKARALAFLVGGKQVFAARVNLPAITMPERSYMRSSLAEMAGEIHDELDVAVVEAIQ